MPYLIRTKNKKKAPLTKYMGAFMPLRIFTSLTVYCLANKVSKTSVMETIFNEWLTHNFTPELEIVYCKTIAAQMQTRYEELMATRRSLTYSIFCEDLKKELETAGLYYTKIQGIMKELDAIHFNR